jgi:hypothetical protein
MRSFLPSVYLVYLVAANPAGLKSLGGQLLQLAGHEMDAEGELIDERLLPAQVVDPDLGVGDSAAESRLGVGLVLAVAVTTRWTTTHPERISRKEC